MIRGLTAALTTTAATTTTAAITAVALGTTGPAAAMGPGVAAKPKTDLVLSYMADAGYAAAVVLTCDPAGGVHPKAAKACATLNKVGGNPGRLKPAPVMCTLEYAPVTAQFKGTWKGAKVNWTKTYPNSCDLARSTGVLFAF